MLSISFKSLKDKLFKYNNFDNYYAHTKGDKCEILKDHIDKTNNYFIKIIDLHGLESVIDKHINKILNVFEEKDKASEFIKLLFFETINLHDIGKINPSFQNMLGCKNIESKQTSLGTSHSILSVYLFYAYMYKKMEAYFTSDKDKGIAYVLILLFSLSIRKHHSSKLTSPFYYFEPIDENKNRFFENVKVSDLINFLNIVNIDKNSNLHEKIFEGENAYNLKNYYADRFISEILKDIDSFVLFSLLKLNSSLLTISDYLATTQFMTNNNQELDIKGVINDSLRKNIYDKFYESAEWNKRLKQNERPKNFNDLEERSNNNLNEIRYKMLYEVRNRLLENKNKNLFFLEAPTGGGKTNMSFMAIAELLKNSKELNKAYYVFPFTTLVTQTKESIIKIFGLKNKDYIELHSKAEFKENEENYGEKWKNYIDYQFINYPITLLTHIRFFDILKSNHKKDNYLYHKLANSIVVIDEIQAYSPEHWDKIYYFIKNVSELFNTVFIIMSATLPKIDEIKLNSGIEFSKFVHLNKDKERYFKNPNFSKRVEFEFIEIEKDLKKLNDIIKQKAEEYFKRNNKVWVLVEFIFKNSASDFFKLIDEEKDNYYKDFKKFMLSGTILEPVRKKIINGLKENKEEYKKVILVSTQVVEAGVDLDFDIGFKDTSIIDSDEQLAGRINRNASKSGCKVYLFDYNKEYRIYGSDYRYKMQKQKFEQKKYLNVLRDKNFDSFYKETLNYINEINKSESRPGFNDYEEAVRKLNFSSVHNKFKLIDQDTISVFVNVEYDLEKYEIENSLGLEEEKDGKKILSGAKVWKKFCSIIENKDIDFLNKKISLIEVIGLMSNFIFSIFKESNLLNKIRWYGEEKYGFLYLYNPTEIYTLEAGIKTEKLDNDIWII